MTNKFKTKVRLLMETFGWKYQAAHRVLTKHKGDYDAAAAEMDVETRHLTPPGVQPSTLFMKVTVSHDR